MASPPIPSTRLSSSSPNRVLDTKGFVSDEDLDAFRAAGYTDEHIAEATTILAQKTLSNYFNHIHDTPLDVPALAEI